MPSAPSAFPLLGAPQAPGDEPNLHEGDENLGGRPPEAEGKYSSHRATPGQIRAPSARPTEMMAWRTGWLGGGSIC